MSLFPSRGIRGCYRVVAYPGDPRIIPHAEPRYATTAPRLALLRGLAVGVRPALGQERATRPRPLHFHEVGEDAGKAPANARLGLREAQHLGMPRFTRHQQQVIEFAYLAFTEDGNWR